MPDPRRYPAELNAVIWALMIEGLRPADIHRRLLAGRAGLPESIGPIDIPARAVRERCQRLRRERGDPVKTIKAGEELDAAAAIRRRGIELLERQIDTLEIKSHRGALTSGEIESVRRALAALDETRRRAAVAEKRDAEPFGPDAGGEARALTPATSELDRLAAELEADGAEG